MRFLFFLLFLFLFISTKTVFAQTQKNDTAIDSLNSFSQKTKWIAVSKNNNSYTAFWLKEIDSLTESSSGIMQITGLSRIC